MVLRLSLAKLQLTLRAAVAGGVATWFAQLLGMEHPLYAFIAAVIVTDLSPRQTRSLGGRRVFATILGALVGAALASAIGSGPLAVALGVIVAMGAGYALGAGDGARVAGYICGIVLLDHTAEPWLYAAQRFVETILGVAVASAISFVPRLVEPLEGDD